MSWWQRIVKSQHNTEFWASSLCALTRTLSLALVHCVGNTDSSKPTVRFCLLILKENLLMKLFNMVNATFIPVCQINLYKHCNYSKAILRCKYYELYNPVQKSKAFNTCLPLPGYLTTFTYQDLTEDLQGLDCLFLWNLSTRFYFFLNHACFMLYENMLPVMKLFFPLNETSALKLSLLFPKWICWRF